MALIMVAGPIKHWWDENWNTPEHWYYALWRARVTEGLTNSYYLSYRPDEAFKGSWDERGQAINDFVLRICDVVLNLTPPNTPSQGTDGEVLYAKNFGKLILDCPPPATEDEFDSAIIELLAALAALNLNMEPVGQRNVIDTLALPEHRLKVPGFVASYIDKNLRIHLLKSDGVHIVNISSENFRENDASEAFKIEVLDKTSPV